MAALEEDGESVPPVNPLRCIYQLNLSWPLQSETGGNRRVDTVDQHHSSGSQSIPRLHDLPEDDIFPSGTAFETPDDNPEAETFPSGAAFETPDTATNSSRTVVYSRSGSHVNELNRTFEHRLRSFSNYPGSDMEKERLAFEGFTYEQRRRHVKCFHCGVICRYPEVPRANCPHY